MFLKLVFSIVKLSVCTIAGKGWMDGRRDGLKDGGWKGVKREARRGLGGGEVAFYVCVRIARANALLQRDRLAT
jgi:hypothetical protein